MSTVTFHQGDGPDDETDVADVHDRAARRRPGAARSPLLTFRATLDTSEAHFFVELLDVAPSGDETRVNEGFLAASHRRSHTDPEPVPVGVTTEYRIVIRAHHHRFRAGNRVRLRVSGGAASRLTRPPAPVTVTMETGATACCTSRGSRTFADQRPPDR